MCRTMKLNRIIAFTALLAVRVTLLSVLSVRAAPSAKPTVQMTARAADFATAVAFDTSPTLRELAAGGRFSTLAAPSTADIMEIRPDRGAIPVNKGFSVGDVGPNHYVEMINLVFAVYSKTGTLLLGPVDTGTLWQGFAVPDCTDPSGNPIVVYDQFVDRWILTQFTTSGFDDPTRP
jgi:hypothetical protein